MHEKAPARIKMQAGAFGWNFLKNAPLIVLLLPFSRRKTVAVSANQSLLQPAHAAQSG
jgi:hypothetical protein